MAFIPEGAITVFIVLIAVLIMRRLPGTTSWLSEEEKQMAV